MLAERPEHQQQDHVVLTLKEAETTTVNSRTISQSPRVQRNRDRSRTIRRGRAGTTRQRPAQNMKDRRAEVRSSA